MKLAGCFPFHGDRIGSVGRGCQVSAWAGLRQAGDVGRLDGDGSSKGVFCVIISAVFGKTVHFPCSGANYLRHRVTEMPHGASFLSRGVYFPFRGVTETSRGVTETSRGVTEMSRGVTEMSRGVTEMTCAGHPATRKKMGMGEKMTELKRKRMGMTHIGRLAPQWLIIPW